MTTYDIPSVESFRSNDVFIIKSLNELENRARKYIVDSILNNASIEIKRKVKNSEFDHSTRLLYGIDIYSKLISAGSGDLFADAESRFIAVEKKNDGKCCLTTYRHTGTCTKDLDGCKCYDIIDNDQYDTTRDVDTSEYVRYFPLDDVLGWPEVHEDLQAVLEPLGYSVCVVFSDEGDFGSYIRVVASFKNPNFV